MKKKRISITPDTEKLNAFQKRQERLKRWSEIDDNITLTINCEGKHQKDLILKVLRNNLTEDYFNDLDWYTD